MKIPVKNIARSAMLAALTAVCAQIAVPLPGSVPLSLASFAVMLSGALLGPQDGAISQLVYLLMGIIGLPVFASFQGGPGCIVGPTGGYLLGYIPMASVIGQVTKGAGKSFPRYLAAMSLGTLICYLFGTAWYLFSTKVNLLAACVSCVFPFLAGDILKIVSASLIACRLQGKIKQR